MTTTFVENTPILSGLIDNSTSVVEEFKTLKQKYEDMTISESQFNYDDISSLRLEARQKLKMFKPISIGQASRISGVSPADIAILMTWLKAGGGRG